jgi:acyl carrier protein
MTESEQMHLNVDTAASVQRILAEELDIAVGDLEPGRQLEDLGVDSLGMIEVMFRMEEEFDIRMGDEQVPLKTVQDVVDLVSAKIRDRQKQSD